MSKIQEMFPNRGRKMFESEKAEAKAFNEKYAPRPPSGLVDWLLNNRTKEELASEVKKLAHENAALRNRVGVLEHEIFWIRATEEKLQHKEEIKNGLI